jgi:hypothetical protein
LAKSTEYEAPHSEKPLLWKLNISGTKGHELANRFELAHSIVSIIWNEEAKYFKEVKNSLQQLRMPTFATWKFTMKRKRCLHRKPL